MATSIDQKDFVKTALRLPPEVHAKIHEAAQESGRSYNAELVNRLERSIADDDRTEARNVMEASLTAIQTMLAFHLRQFYELLPPDVQRKPINQAVRDMANALGHGSAEKIEESLMTYFDTKEGGPRMKWIANTLHARRQQLDAQVKRDQANDPEPIESTVKRIRAKP